MAEHQLPKLTVRVRFPSSAPENSTGASPHPRIRSRVPGTRTAKVSIWDTFAHTPGNISNDDSGDVANDHYHRYAEDVALMKSTGVNAYRFSISGRESSPRDRRAQSQRTRLLQRTRGLVTGAGIEPFATLYHWDLPQALQDRVRRLAVGRHREGVRRVRGLSGRAARRPHQAHLHAQRKAIRAKGGSDIKVG